ncbi:sugar-binding transcriptional regulator [Luteococcus sp. Sow4_B9]|uniref:sugar-binding transcriptional regulator n=1 Tax=Luteococcus sp. Sow4_B9 TaxID=3438792 RepID=UPI003F992861
MNERSDHLYLAASLYYVQGETMESIARQLNVSRSSVSRLLKQARESGVVQITLTNPAGPRTSLGAHIGRAFGVRAHVVPVREGASDVHRLERVARAAGQLISESIRDDMVIGTAWGTTLGSVVQYLSPREARNTTVVQMNGAANPNTSGLRHVEAINSQFANAFSSTVVPFPVPAFFDYAQTRRAMWRERSIQSVLALHERIDLALFGVGGLSAEVPSQVYAQGYLDEADWQQLADERVVGDVNTVFLREDGSWQDIPLNDRASGMTPDQLHRLPRRICVVAGAAKARALRGALRARVATDVVLDEACAQALLEPLEPALRR